MNFNYNLIFTSYDTHKNYKCINDYAHGEYVKSNFKLVKSIIVNHKGFPIYRLCLHKSLESLNKIIIDMTLCNITIFPNIIKS